MNNHSAEQSDFILCEAASPRLDDLAAHATSFGYTVEVHAQRIQAIPILITLSEQNTGLVVACALGPLNQLENMLASIEDALLTVLWSRTLDRFNSDAERVPVQ